MREKLYSRKGHVDDEAGRGSGMSHYGVGDGCHTGSNWNGDLEILTEEELNQVVGGRITDFAMPGCEEYAQALMEKATETGAKDLFKECKNKESKIAIKQCFWEVGMDLVDATDATPSEPCIENVKRFFKN